MSRYDFKIRIIAYKKWITLSDHGVSIEDSEKLEIPLTQAKHNYCWFKREINWSDMEKNKNNK